MKGELLHKKLMKKTTPQQRREYFQNRTVPAIRKRWETITPAELERWTRTHIDPRPKGQFNLCRVCAKLTYLPPSAIRKGCPGEYHQVCLMKWRSESRPPGRG